MQPALRLLIDFTDPAEVARWRSIDDAVMGGRSSSRLVTDDDGSALFTGRVSFEDGGGFASVRTTGARCALEGARSVRLRVRGDGKTYRLRCIAATPSGEIGYQARFPTTADAWSASRSKASRSPNSPGANWARSSTMNYTGCRLS